jgi:hypothetical protein
VNNHILESACVWIYIWFMFILVIPEVADAGFEVGQ